MPRPYVHRLCTECWALVSYILSGVSDHPPDARSFMPRPLSQRAVWIQKRPPPSAFELLVRPYIRACSRFGL